MASVLLCAFGRQNNVHGYADDPGGQSGSSVKGIETCEHFQECILGEVGGPLALACHAIAQRIDAVLIPIEE